MRFVRNLLALPKRWYSIAKIMEKESIVPDVIDCAPTDKATIIYSGGIQFCSAPNCYHTLIMTSPDEPCRANPAFKECHHWLVVNIPEDCVAAGEVLSQYIGSHPAKDTGLHRYVFLIFKQPRECCFDEPRLSNRSKCFRDKFSTRKFAAKYNLGLPISGNFFQAQFDSYVPVINNMLNEK